MLGLFHKESKTIIGAATIVGLLSGASRIVGFVRDRVLAGTFGAGDTLDIYYAAFKIPDLLFQLIAVGAISASFIPLFLSHYHTPLQKQRAWAFTNNTVHLIGVAVVAVSILCILFAHPLVEIIAPGFHDVKQLRVVSFMRVMFLSQFFLAISMVYGSVLQGLKRFFLYSLAPIFYNLGIMVGALALVPWLGPIGLAWGVVLGSVLHLVIQLLGMRHTGYRYQFRFEFRSQETREMVRLMAPRTVGLAVNQLMFILLSMIASTLVAGSLTVFQFAYNIQFFPIGIIGVSFAIAVFPSLSQFIQAGQKDAFITTVVDTTKQLLYLLLPMTVLFLVLRAQAVRVVVGAGAFDWSATIATADTLAFFALTFIPQSLVFLLARAFYALHDTITPLVVAIVSALVGILSAFLLKGHFGVVALGMAYSLASLVNAGLLWVCLRQRMGTLREWAILASASRLMVCACISGLLIQITKPFMSSLLPLDTFVGVLSQGAIAGGLGLVAYVGLVRLLKVEEQARFFTALRRGILRQAPVQEVPSDG